ncbi:MAG TPA: hypothetical protein EYN69_10270 [Flavobacteriales bacterium]|nr:hypothetical protein [Flavobacteriales bacterium]
MEVYVPSHYGKKQFPHKGAYGGGSKCSQCAFGFTDIFFAASDLLTAPIATTGNVDTVGPGQYILRSYYSLLIWFNLINK